MQGFKVSKVSRCGFFEALFVDTLEPWNLATQTAIPLPTRIGESAVASAANISNACRSTERWEPGSLFLHTYEGRRIWYPECFNHSIREI